jgi:serine phosphatase RsbU (regulator of sigma subunit)
MAQGTNGKTAGYKTPFREILTEKPLRLLSSFFCFWRPSVARRITLYFIIFGILIFLVSTVLYVVAAKRGFVRSTGNLIQNQFNQHVSITEPDYFLKRVNRSEPDLFRTFQILQNLSSGHHSVADVAIYSREAVSAAWLRLYFRETDVLRSEVSRDSMLEKLDRRLKMRFHRMSSRLFSEDGVVAMFVNLTGDSDVNQYFLRIELDSEDLAAFIASQFRHYLFFLLIIIVVSRMLAHVFVRKIATPIENLSESVTKVAKGDLSKMVPVTTQDEIGQLAVNFNTMIEELREWERVKEIEFELEKGQAIQKEFLPRNIPSMPNYEIAASFQPAGKVSGDFYDVFLLPGGCMGLVIADVCDKGVGSALYMALFRSLIRVYAIQPLTADKPDFNQNDVEPCDSKDGSILKLDPLEGLRAVSSTNNYIAEIHGDEGMFATVFFGVLDPSTNQLCYVNGGHEPLFLIGNNGLKGDLRPTGPAVGMMPDMKFEIERILLEPGDTLLGYTDGVTEARSPGDELFTRHRLQSLFSKPAESPADLLDRIQSDLFRFIGSATRNDDVTMLAVQRMDN